AQGEALRAAWRRATEVTAAAWATGDATRALANASAYLEAVGHVVLAWLWLDVALAADPEGDGFHQGKRQACRYFFRYELPRTEAQFALVAALDSTVLDTDPDWL
ncbi:acyl-CoA dehydrogenase C-terminal domain-containing protein, partial [Streptomyces sparsus]